MDGPAGTAPVFFVGMPRSGTTVLFELFVRSSTVAWPSNFTERFPLWPSLNAWRRVLENPVMNIQGEKAERGDGRRFNRLRVRPAEAYPFWDAFSGRNFSRDFLSGVEAGREEASALRQAVDKVCRYQGRERFAAKFTGPGRVQYLRSVFPRSRFVHVVRDGRAVVHSLMAVPFWRDKGGLSAPFWEGGLQSADHQRLQQCEHRAENLAALQWRRVLEVTKAELSELPDTHWTEIRYEDLVAHPKKSLEALLAFAGHEFDADLVAALVRGRELRNMNDKYKRRWSEALVDEITETMAPALRSLGYIE